MNLLEMVKSNDMDLFIKYLQTTENLSLKICDLNDNGLLHHAVLNRSLEMIKLLLALGVSPNTKNNLGKSPLDLAKEYQCEPEIIDVLKIANLRLVSSYYDSFFQKCSLMEKELSPPKINSLQAMRKVR